MTAARRVGSDHGVSARGQAPVRPTLMRLARAPIDHPMALFALRSCRSPFHGRRLLLVARGFLVPAGLLLNSSCGGERNTGPDPTGPGPAASVALHAGADQTAPVGASVPVAPAVRITDAEDRPVPSVRVSFAVASGGGTVTQGSATTNADGVATVGRWQLGPTTGANTLTATAVGTGIRGNPATFAATGVSGAPAELSFVVQPSSTTAGAPMQVSVAVRDAAGNTVTSATGAITVAIGSNPGGGSLSGVTTVSPVNGVAMFSGLALDKAGGGYSMMASSTPLASATSVAFAISAAAPVRLSFTHPPSNAVAGALIAPAVQIAIQDVFGNTVLSATDAVTVSLGTNQSGGTLSGATTVSAVDGVARFSNLSVEKSGSGYALLAASGGLTGAQSAAFSVSPGPVASVWVNPGALVLTFPSGTSGGQLQAVPMDAYGNEVSTLITWSSTTTAATVDASGYVSAFGEGVAVIRASAGGEVGSATVSVQCGPPRCSPTPTLGFSQPPTAAAARTVISPAVQVTASNLGSCWTGTVSLVLGNNPTHAILSGNTAMPISYGNQNATWINLTVDKPGSGYTLVAIATGGCAGTGDNGGATSGVFSITP